MPVNNSYTNNSSTGSNYANPAHQLKQAKLNQSHEQTILTENNKHQIEVLDKKNKYNIDLKKKELGWFGIFFGGRELISLNISGMLIIFLIITGLILSYKIYSGPEDLDNVVTIWGIISPIITLTLGYIFGNKSAS